MTVTPHDVIALAPRRARHAHSPAVRRLAFLAALSFAITALGLLVTPAPALAWTAGEFNATSEQELVALHNQARANAGLKALRIDPDLTSIARWRSKDMITRDYFSHSIPGGGSVFDEMQDRGYCFKLAGENIGWNNYPDDIATEAIHQMFMDSPGHRDNIMGAAWDLIGVGAYKGPTGKKMWTVLFVDACGSAAPAPTATPKATPKPTPKPTAAPTPRPTAAPTPKPTAAPTPRPVAAPTPRLTPAPAPPDPEPTVAATTPPTPDPTPTRTPTPVPSAAPTPTVPPPAFDDPIDPLEAARLADHTRGADRPATTGAAPDDSGAPLVGLRVAEPTTSPGLLDSIVGGVAGFFFGS